MKEITIPEGVTTLGAQSFAECTGLSNIEIPSSIIEIRSSAFNECSGLMNVFVAAANASFCDVDGVLFSKDKTEILLFPRGRNGSYSIPAGVTIIGDSAFESCEDITSVSAPLGVEKIGEYAFRSCSKLTSVILPVGLKLIKNWAFSGCSALKHIDIPDGVDTFEWGAFYCCYELETINLPSSLKVVKSSSFGYDSKLRDVYYSGTQTQWSLIDIEDYYNEPLKNATLHFTSAEFVLPGTLSFIESEAFAGVNAQTIIVPKSVGVIGSRAFSDCKNLEILVFEGSPNEIAADAVAGCDKLKNVYASADSSAELWANNLGLTVVYH